MVVEEKLLESGKDAHEHRRQDKNYLRCKLSAKLPRLY